MRRAWLPGPGQIARHDAARHGRSPCRISGRMGLVCWDAVGAQSISRAFVGSPRANRSSCNGSDFGVGQLRGSRAWSFDQLDAQMPFRKEGGVGGGKLPNLRRRPPNRWLRLRWRPARTMSLRRGLRGLPPRPTTAARAGLPVLRGRSYQAWTHSTGSRLQKRCRDPLAGDTTRGPSSACLCHQRPERRAFGW